MSENNDAHINTMENAIHIFEDADSWSTVMLLYNSALKKINIKLEILNDEFQHAHQYNPIEHVKTRLKSAESIVRKLKRRGYESTTENMVKYVNDIAGVRVICSFTSDIYRIADMLSSQSDIHVLFIKDYIKNLLTAKGSGGAAHRWLCSMPHPPSLRPDPRFAARVFFFGFHYALRALLCQEMQGAH